MEREQQQAPTAGATKKSKLWLWVLILIIIVGTASVILLLKKTDSGGTATTNQIKTTETVTESKAVETWQDGGVAIAGKYADADVVDLGNGSYRIYYSAEPEVIGFNGQIYSATSTDGTAWKEEGDVRAGATFPDLIKLPDGRWRMYYQNNQVIKSAISIDGLKFTDESGTRIDKTETGFTIDNVAASSTTILADGSYLMVYRGLINTPYSKTEKLPNQTIQLFFYATSADGLTWQKKGLALDSRNETLLGLADGAELVKWIDPSTDSGQAAIRLYFWSYKGVYHTKYENGAFGSTPIFDFTNSANLNAKFSENPPGDPTLIKIGEKWFMYYGQHTKGIYYATLNK